MLARERLLWFKVAGEGLSKIVSDALFIETSFKEELTMVVRL